jgi:phenylpropionate dioxygenase-like ring-hydroxylating dioxygenase large terminal subunit
LGLRPVATETWEGLIFVNFDPEHGFSLKEWLGEFHGQYEGYFTSHEKVAYFEVDLACNWHLAVNSFTEGYHTLFIHQNTVGDYQGGKPNPQRRRPFLEMLERHYRYSAPANPNHQTSPAEDVAFADGRPKLLPSFGRDSSGTPVGINPGEVDLWAFDVGELFPNFVFLAEKHWHIEIYSYPTDAGHTRMVVDVYAYKAKTPSERISQEFFLSRGRQVVREDLNTLEAQQQGAGVRRPGPCPSDPARAELAASLAGPQPNDGGGLGMSSDLFPKEFADLADLGAEWVIATARKRHLKRMASDLDTIRAFYERMLPRLTEISDYLDRYSLDAMPAPAKRLFDLALTAMEMSHPIDMGWKSNDIDDSFPAERMKFLPVLSRINDGLPE